VVRARFCEGTGRLEGRGGVAGPPSAGLTTARQGEGLCCARGPKDNGYHGKSIVRPY